MVRVFPAEYTVPSDTLIDGAYEPATMAARPEITQLLVPVKSLPLVVGVPAAGAPGIAVAAVGGSVDEAASASDAVAVIVVEGALSEWPRAVFALLARTGASLTGVTVMLRVATLDRLFTEEPSSTWKL